MADGASHHPEQEIEKGKFTLSAAEFSVDAGSPLPEGYGENRLVMMTRDPFWFFAYWEITHERAEQIRVAHGRDSWDKSVLILRVYDLGEASQTSIENAASFDVPVQKFARQCYAQVPIAGHGYVADLGLRWPDGKFVSLFRSNVIKQPAGQVSDQVDQQWASVGTVSAVAERKAWETMAHVAMGAGPSKGGSGDVSNTTSLRWEFLKSVFSGSVSSWRPDTSLASGRPTEPKKS